MTINKHRPYAGQQLGDVLAQVFDRIEQLEQEVATLKPQLDKMEQYPALREAYAQYKLMEKLCQ